MNHAFLNISHQNNVQLTALPMRQWTLCEDAFECPGHGNVPKKNSGFSDCKSEPQQHIGCLCCLCTQPKTHTSSFNRLSASHPESG